MFTMSNRITRTATRATAPAAPCDLLPLESRTVMSGASFYDAIPLYMNHTSGEIATTGEITGSGQRYFRFTADQNGLTALSVDPKIPLNATLELYDSSGRLLARPATRAGAGQAEGMVFQAFEGRSYFVRVLGEFGSRGRFAMTVDGARQIDTSHGTVSVRDRLDFLADEDGFNFTPTRSGRITINLDPTGSLDGQIRIYNSSGGQIGGTIDRYGSGRDETVILDATAGRTYRVVVTGRNGQTGGYTLTLVPPTAPPPRYDDHANAGYYYDATRIPILASSGNGLGGGAIETYGDTDLFKFTAAGSGTVWIRINPRGSLDSIARAYDTRGFLITSADSGGSGAAEWLRLDVVRGETFYLLVDGYGSSTGAYDVEIDGPSW